MSPSAGLPHHIILSYSSSWLASHRLPVGAIWVSQGSVSTGTDRTGLLCCVTKKQQIDFLWRFFSRAAVKQSTTASGGGIFPYTSFCTPVGRIIGVLINHGGLFVLEGRVHTTSRQPTTAVFKAPVFTERWMHLTSVAGDATYKNKYERTRKKYAGDLLIQPFHIFCYRTRGCRAVSSCWSPTLSSSLEVFFL